MDDRPDVTSITQKSLVACEHISGGSGKRQLADGLSRSPSASPAVLPLPPICWLLLSLLPVLSVTPLFAADAWFKTLFLLVFAASVQTLFFEMLPIKYLHGRGIFQFNRLLWLVLFIVTTVVFLQTMLNPDGAFVGAFNSANMVVLSLVVVAFCVVSAVVWFYLQRLEKAEAAKAASAVTGE